MKVRLEFEKNIRYISHLELMKAMGKILKRADLPLKYSNGFNPHIVLSVANPIPVGVCGKSEFADFELTCDMDKDEIIKRIKKASPAGIFIKDIHINCKKDFNSADRAFYEIEISVSDEEKLKEYLARDVMEVEKTSKGKTKIINLKEYIYDISYKKDDESLILKCTLACGQQKNLNPMLMKKAIENEGLAFRRFLPLRLDVTDGNNEDFRR
jgi:radical SAM-linked protein